MTWYCLATASYRLVPRIRRFPPIAPKHQRKFRECPRPGVISIRKNRSTGVDEVYIQDARKDTVSREVLRHGEFKDVVELTRVRDYFLCTFFRLCFLSSIASSLRLLYVLLASVKVESAGNTTPQRLFPLAVNVMRLKIHKLKQDVHEHLIPKWQSRDQDVTMVNA